MKLGGRTGRERHAPSLRVIEIGPGRPANGRDGILKVLDHDINRLGVVLDEIAAAAGDSIKVTVTVSADEAALPHDVKKYL